MTYFYIVGIIIYFIQKSIPQNRVRKVLGKRFQWLIGHHLIAHPGKAANYIVQLLSAVLIFLFIILFVIVAQFLFCAQVV